MPHSRREGHSGKCWASGSIAAQLTWAGWRLSSKRYVAPMSMRLVKANYLQVLEIHAVQPA